MAASLMDLGKSFARALKAEGRSPATLRLYGQSVRFFADWLESQGRPATLDELTRDAVREWLGALTDRVESATVRTRYRGLYRFCAWLADESEIAANPMKGMSPPTSRDKPVPVLTDDDLTKLLKACSGKTFADRRDEAMVRILLDSGLRVSELCGLTVTGTDLDQGSAVVLGKGSKFRAVYFGSRTTRALDRYIRLRAGHRWAGLDQLFLTQRGALSPDGARERLNILTARAGLDHVHPHQFRHTFAHDFLMAGGQERDLKRLAGWSSDAMLERYGASAADARAKVAAKRFNRGDRV